MVWWILPPNCERARLLRASISSGLDFGVSGMEGCRDAKRGAAATAADDLPDDAVVEILSRRPASP